MSGQDWKVNIYDSEEMAAWQAAQRQSFELEETRQRIQQQQHEDWLRVQDRSHAAWVEIQDRAIAAWERMAAALEVLAGKEGRS